MYGTNSTALPQLAATGAVGIGYLCLGGIVLIYAGVALLTVAAVLRHRARRG